MVVQTNRRDFLGVGLLGAALLLFWVLSGNPAWMAVMVMAGLYVLLTSGLLLLTGYAGQVSLGHAGFYACGAYISAILTTRLDLSPWLGLVGAALLTAGLAWLIGRPTLRLRGYYLGMGTIAFGVVVEILLLELPELTGGVVGLRGIPRLSIGPYVLRSDGDFFLLVWGVALLVIAFTLGLLRSYIGRLLRAIDANETAAACMGLSVADLKLRIFVWSAALAGLAGGLYAHYMTYISPTVFTVELSVLLIMMVFVGGKEHPWGGVLGAVLLTLLSEKLREMGDINVGVFGLLLFLLVLYMPNGIAPALEGAWRKWVRRGQSHEPA